MSATTYYDATLHKEVDVTVDTPMPVTFPGTGASSNQVQGNVADGTTDAGNPVGIGGQTQDPDSLPAASTAGKRRPVLLDLFRRVLTWSWVQGTVAHDAADANNPVGIGGNAQDPDSPPSQVTVGDRVRLIADRVGRLITWMGSRLDPTNDSVSIGLSATSQGGADTFRSLAVTNSAATVKSAAGRLGWITVTNRHSAIIYLHFYDASAPTITADAPKMSFGVAASSLRDLMFPVPIAFATAIKIAATTEANPEGGVATAPGTLPVINIGYK